MTARQWLAANKYDDVVEAIDRVEAIWRSRGCHTRRNWWEVLAGGAKGAPRTVEGISFPVLAAAQKHQHIAVTPNAVQRSEVEEPPSLVYHGSSLARRTAG